MSEPGNDSLPAKISNSRCPPFRALIKYLNEQFNRPENADSRDTQKLSNWFLTCLCLLLGVVSNLKLEVATYSGLELENDLAYVLLSDEDTLYLDDVDLSAVRWNLEVADFIAVLISCFFIWYSSTLTCPLSEYALLPWLGLTLRGLLARQAVSALALAYVFAAAEGKVRMLFSTVYSALFLVEVRLWLEVGRLVLSRWNTHHPKLYRDNLASKKEKYLDFGSEVHVSEREAARAVNRTQR